MLKELFRPGTPFPIDKKGAIKYTEELAEGLAIWAKIDIFVLLAVFILYVFGFINNLLIGIAILFMIGCPVIMVIGFLIGCLHYLTILDVWRIVKNRF